MHTLVIFDCDGVLVGLGHSDVQTLLNSGNAVFQTRGTAGAAHAKAIAWAITKGLGFDVPVIVKSAKEWAAIVQNNPFADQAEEPTRLLVAVTQDAAALAALKTIETLGSAPEAFRVGSYAAYLHCPAGILESKAATALLDPGSS